MKRIWAVALLGLVACGPGPGAREQERPAGNGEAKEPSKHEEPEGSAEEVRIAPEMLRDLRITTAAVESRPGGEGVAVLGELGVDEDRYAEVSSAILAQAVRLLAAAGQRVGAGQPVLELSSLEVGRARGELKEAEARAALARQSLERKRGLAEERIAPLREVQEAEAELRASEAALTAATSTLESLGVESMGPGGQFVLRSPVAGVVLQRSVVRGQVVQPGSVLLRIGDLSKLWLVAHASERDALRVKPGATARISFPAIPGRTFAARVALVGKQVDAASRTIPVRLDVANQEGGLRPGMSATVWLPVGEGGTLLAVPAASLQRLHESWCVFVPKGEGVFEIRTVARGRDLGGEVEVLSGLAVGETVVVDGAFLLKAEGEKAEGEGGHHDH